LVSRKEDVHEYSKIFGKGIFWLIVLVFVVGLFQCDGGDMNLDGVEVFS
jgi:hypothetical protein